MSFELCVYAPDAGEPAMEDISKLLGLAGWRWAAVAGGPAPRRAERLHGVRALGWESADGIGAAVNSALAMAAGEALAELSERLSIVSVEVEAPFRPDAEAVAELREEGHEPELVTRIEDAAACYRFSTDEPATEEAVDFLWSLASAVGVLTDGVLEDLEDGALLDCTDNDDE
jgi:hypothetical protein